MNTSMNTSMNTPMTALDRALHMNTLYSRTLHEAALKLALSEAEARCILDACGGRWAPHQLGLNLRTEVQSALEGTRLNDKWEISAASLVHRIRRLTSAYTVAVEVWVMDWVDWSTAPLDDPGWGPGWEKAHLALVVLPPSRRFSATSGLNGSAS